MRKEQKHQQPSRRYQEVGKIEMRSTTVERVVSVEELCCSMRGVTKILGTMDRCSTTPAPIDDANEQSVSFCSGVTEDALDTIRNSKAGIIICSDILAPSERDYQDRTLILVPRPRAEFIRIVRDYFEVKTDLGVHPTATVDEGVEVPSSVYIGPHCHLHPKVRIGNNVIIHAGTVIGSDGFGYERSESGELEKFPHIGGVVIGDDVEIGANVCIDRGTIHNTIIGKGTKIDNLCHIAHNVVVGKHCMIIAHSMIGGGTKIGDYAHVAPHSCLRDGIEIGERTLVGLGSVVTKSHGSDLVIFGVPARVQGGNR